MRGLALSSALALPSPPSPPPLLLLPVPLTETLPGAEALPLRDAARAEALLLAQALMKEAAGEALEEPALPAELALLVPPVPTALRVPAAAEGEALPEICRPPEALL